MIRKEAMALVANYIKNEPIISANGYISRDLFEVNNKRSNFYMIGSMGLASSIALGVAIKHPKKKIFVFDGDGNILMNLGSLTTIGTIRPNNFIHVIFDNGIHESTGGQPTNTKKIHLEKIADSVNYKVFKASSKKQLETILQRIRRIVGPIMIIVKIENSRYVSKRINLKPREIRNLFMNSLIRN